MFAHLHIRDSGAGRPAASPADNRLHFASRTVRDRLDAAGDEKYFAMRDLRDGSCRQGVSLPQGEPRPVFPSSSRVLYIEGNAYTSY